MYAETTYLSYTNRLGQRVTFAGFTQADFTNRCLGGFQKAKKEYIEKHTVPLIADLSDPEVQLALIGSFCIARDAAAHATTFFDRQRVGKQPSKLHAEIFAKLFSLKNPGKDDYAVLMETFDKTRRGLEGAVLIRDSFRGADQDPAGPGWGPGEGEVLIPPEIRKAYFLRARKKDNNGDIMRAMLEKEAKDIQDIHVRFNLVKELTKDGLARVIFHEATHKFAYTGDYQYIYDDTSMHKTKSKHALYNADSYAFAAMSAHLGRLVTKKDLTGAPTCKEPLHDLGWLKERAT